MDLSILIVHFNTPGLLRQTLRGIRKSAPRLLYEVIVVDNNPNERIAQMVAKEFPEMKVIQNEKNEGFGAGMNKAMKEASADFFLIFNPDIALFANALESLLTFMKSNDDIGMLGPQLLNPDKSVQHSCYRFMRPQTILFRRVPLLRKTYMAKNENHHYTMAEWDHASIKDVDYLLGACMLVRRKAYEEVGGFDPNFFVYFEDQDWCRRFWKSNWRVVYFPEARMVHYHRRETAEGGFLKQIMNPLTRIQLQSAWRYFKKYHKQDHPTI